MAVQRTACRVSVKPETAVPMKRWVCCFPPLLHSLPLRQWNEKISPLPPDPDVLLLDAQLIMGVLLVQKHLMERFGISRESGCLAFAFFLFASFVDHFFLPSRRKIECFVNNEADPSRAQELVCSHNRRIRGLFRETALQLAGDSPLERVGKVSGGEKGEKIAGEAGVRRVSRK